MSRSLWCASAGAMVLGFLLGGCAAAPVTDPAEVQEWLSKQDAAGDGDTALLAQLSAMSAAEPDQHVVESESGITAEFAAPVRVTDLTFSCFGAESMAVQLWVSSEQGVEGRIIEDLRCDESPQVLDDPGLSGDGVTKVTVNGWDPDGAGAWTILVHGSEEAAAD